MGAKENLNTIKGRCQSYETNPWFHQENDKYYAGDKDLAYAGLYAFPTEEVDTVKCFYCERVIAEWDEEDIPWEEHKLISPECMLANLTDIEQRVKTFEIGEWTTRGPMKATIEEFAEAGFFFYPYDSKDDTLMCFQCGVCLDGWDYDDDPLIEHKKRNDRCPYVVMGVDLGKKAYDLYLKRETVHNAKSKISYSEEKQEKEKRKNKEIGKSIQIFAQTEEETQMEETKTTDEAKKGNGPTLEDTVEGYFEHMAESMKQSIRRFSDSLYKEAEQAVEARKKKKE